MSLISVKSFSGSRGAASVPRLTDVAAIHRRAAARHPGEHEPCAPSDECVMPASIPSGGDPGIGMRTKTAWPTGNMMSILGTH